MTFKVKAGINVGSINVIDADARYQQVLGTPNIRPTLNLDFINNQAVESRFSFSRASTGTFVDSKGLVATAATNNARFEYANGLPRGLLVENPRTNLATYSEDFTFSDYVINNSATRIPFATIAPDGSLTGTIWTSAAIGGSGFYRFVGGLSTSTQYTQSIYIKNISGATNLRIGCDVNPVNATVTFNAVTGVITAAGANVTYSSVTNIGNGWYRVTITFTSTTTSPSFICYSQTGSVTSWAVWGFQTEAGPNPTSYVPSSTTFTSRSSSASYQDSADGLIKYAGVNLLTYSNTLSDVSWVKGGATTVTANADIAPDGTNTAWRLTMPLGAQTFLYHAFSAVNGTTYTFSVYMKSSGIQPRCFITFTGTGGTGSFVTSNDVTTTNTWTRYSVTYTATSTGTLFVEFENALNVVATDILIWGAQVEEGTTPTLYAETAASLTAAARPAYNPLTKVNRQILIEPAATNLFPQSTLTSTGWAYGAEVAVNAATAPDGTTTAAIVTVPAATIYNSVYFNIGSTVASSTVYTWTMYIRLGTMVAADFRFAMYDLTNSTFIAVDIVPTITPVSYEWRRITYTFTTPSTCTSVRPYFYRNNSTGAGGTVQCWGGQLELGSYATSYIPTNGSSVTRAADAFSVATTTRSADIVTLPALNWFDNAQGTWVIEYDSSNWPNTPLVIKGDNGEYITGRALNSVGTWNGTSEVNTSAIGANVAVGVVAAVSYNSAGRVVALNGDVPTSGSGAFLNSTVIYLGSVGSPGTRAIDGRIRDVSFYPIAVSNTQLQALTRI